jgi:hypothetical protein
MVLMAILMYLPKELFDTIKEIKEDCERLKKEKDLTEFGEGQLYLIKIFEEICKRSVK